MKAVFAIFAVLALHIVQGQTLRSEENFDQDWLFARYGLQSDNSRVNEPAHLEALSIDDRAWRKLDLPHDWAIEGPFHAALDGNTGKLPWRGIGWYRKHFKTAKKDNRKQFYLDFDGAMANAEVWLNGKKIGERPYGYASFRVDLTPYLFFGKENVLAVRLDTEKWGSRWYSGAGIYRHVRLVKTNPIHVAHWGVYVTTPILNDETGTVRVDVAIANNLIKKAEVQVQAKIYEIDSNDTAGREAAASDKKSVSINALENNTVSLELNVANPLRWDLQNTNRYAARVFVYSGGKATDVKDTPFGFRTIEFTHDNGFLLNGKRVPIQGTCNHHDLGALGAAVNTSALQRQLSILKSVGCNALRTSHNPPAPELLTLADKMGFLVMDEAFDTWEHEKTPYDYASIYKEWHERDLQMCVMRDRNHPSVILWSTGNEVEEQYFPEKGTARHLTETIKKWDTTRAVTFGASEPRKSAFNGTPLQTDVHGMNYAANKTLGGENVYGRFLAFKGHEKKAAFGSETSSTVSSRGEYFPTQFQAPSYDLNEPGWGSLPDAEFEALDANPGMCGEFVWTGFDYLGEPTPFNTQASILLTPSGASEEEVKAAEKKLEAIKPGRPSSRSSYFGMVDLAGFPKDRYYLYQARWRPELPMVHILPHWNFSDRLGKITPVFVYTSGDEAELFLNGKSLGRKKKWKYRLRWDSAIYEPGELKAVAYKGGKEWAVASVKTAGAAAKLKLTSYADEVKADGDEYAFITVSVVDKEGNAAPAADNVIKCSAEGGEIVATDNGDASCLIAFSNPQRPAFHGLLLAIVKPKTKGPMKITAESQGLETGNIILEVK